MFKHKVQMMAFGLALVTAFSLTAPAVTMAQAPIGSGPNDALAPVSATQHLNVGQERWYAFHSAGADRDNNPSKVLIQLTAQPDGSAQFNIWSMERLRARAISTDPNKDAPAVGQGTKESYKDGDTTLYRFNGALVWDGGFMEPTTYYVQVQQVGSQPSDYQLSITGDAVTFPTATPSVYLASSTTSSAAARANINTAPLVLPATGNQAAPAAAPAGSSLNTAVSAISASGRLMTIKPGAEQWFKISVPGTSDSDVHPYVFADLKNVSGGGANFEVWTPERLQARAISSDPNKDAPMVGAGTMETFKDGDNTVARYGGDMIWRGDAKNALTYYIVVKATGSQPAQYQLTTSLLGQ